MESNKFCVRFGKNKIDVCNVAKTPPVRKTNKLTGTVVLENEASMKFVSDRANSFSIFDTQFSSFVDKIVKMNLKHDETTEIFNQCKSLLNSFKEMCINSIENSEQVKTKKPVCELFLSAAEYISNKFENYSSTYRRKKEVSKNEIYVEPEEKSIGIKWKTTRNYITDLPNNKLINATFQYVSIIKTIKSLFLQPDFSELYFRYNNHEKHKCTEGMYADFCCGSVYRDCDLFRNKNVIQIQLGIDDFEVCCPVKSKTKIHKISAVYFKIRNLPHNISSKLNNIFLVSLCNSSYLKQSNTSFDDIAELILQELHELESNGIDIGLKEYLKGALINISFDNLGGNTVYGIVECFVSNYYCRICELGKDQCKIETCEIVAMLRKKCTYLRLVSRLQAESNSKLDLNASKGIKKMCLFNNLKYFHIFDNVSVDLMHDVNEGLISFFLKHFFIYCVNNKIVTENEIIRKVRDFNYGILNIRNIPSIVYFKKKNLGQNASQAYCLMIHAPLIFVEFRDKLSKVWPIMQSLLQCMQIVYSSLIRESDIVRLEQNIKIHLSGLINIFQENLLPKHHFFTHYPNVIRKMGPVIHMWMMRFESKHKYFTDLAKKTNNFINLTKSLSIRHQAMISASQFICTDKVEKSKKKFVFQNA